MATKMKNTAFLALGLILTASSLFAADISILNFKSEFFALAPGPRGLHSVEIPGGNVVAANVLGEMAEVITSEGVNLITSLRYGVSGRQVHVDMGKVQQVELGSRIALVTAQNGTALYFQGGDRLRGVRISDRFPIGAMVHRDVAVLKWGNKVSLYGAINGQMFRLHLPADQMYDIHLGENTVMSLWGRNSHGTMFHTLTPQGFTSVRLSYEEPGQGSTRSGKSSWQKIEGAEETNIGVPFEKGIPILDVKPSFFGSQDLKLEEVSIK